MKAESTSNVENPGINRFSDCKDFEGMIKAANQVSW